MSNILLALFLTVFMTGCATTQKSLPQITSKKYSELSEKNIKSNTSASLIEQDIKTTIISESDESHIEEQAIEIEPTGIVYAKTNFSGVLEKAYVQLTIYAYNNPTEPIKLVIGDKEQQKALVWDVEPVKPGYFFLNLRQGDYHIT
ncbi:MAG: PBP1b-binding outer membrane lipoprotein LpoB, partial [Candidatus Omnitrophota bacterium]